MMLEDMQDFVAQFLGEEKPPRDRSGRPMLIPRGVEIAEENRVPYTRASGLADNLEDFSFLWKWKMRGLAKGLADSMDLIRLVAAETYTTGFTEDEAANKAAGRRIDEVIERAMDRAGTDQKADYGTAIHARTEPGNVGTDPDDKQRLDQQSCWDLWRRLGVHHLGTEVFTACDELRSAGTFDHLSYVPGYGIVVTDKKTSSKAKQNYDVQLGGYSRSDVYDPETDQRMTLEEFIESKGWDPALLNRSVGIIWWVKGGKTEARLLDLDNGYRWAQVAASIRDERRPQSARVARNVTGPLEKKAAQFRSELLEMIGNCRTRDELLALWANPVNQALWTPDHTEAAEAAVKEAS